uniref:RNase H type-1 domain-containing protein n=1 Tax=Cannabis sativa TaxID=3483 RepID=A0A803P5V0_CANSA
MTGALCTFEVIWRARNNVVHGSSLLPLVEAFKLVRRLFQDYLSRWKTNLGVGLIKTTLEASWLACYTDVLIHLNHSFGVAVFRDSNDRVHTIFSERFAATDPTLVEASMLVSAANFTGKNFFGKVAFHYDNEVVVSNFTNAIDLKRHLNFIGTLDRFKSVVRSLEDLKLMKIDRKHYFLAHNSAKWAEFNSVVGEFDLSTVEEDVFLILLNGFLIGIETFSSCS